MADAESLQELEPSPVDETPSESKDGSYFPDTASSSSKGTHTLGLSGSHSALFYLQRIQKYSTYAFTAFGLAHITNTSIIPLITQSVPASEPYLLLTRPYYEGLPFEPLLIIVPVWAHVLSGLAIRIYRRNLNAKRYGDPDSRRLSYQKATATDGVRRERSFWPAVSGISKLGFLLVPLLVGHVAINRAIPGQVEGGASNVNLSYVSHAFARHPAISFAGFTALITIGCWHITWGWAKWLGYTPEQTTELGSERDLVKKRRWYTINGVAAAVAGLWFAGSFGVVARGGAASGWLGRQYDEIYRLIPIVGRWM